MDTITGRKLSNRRIQVFAKLLLLLDLKRLILMRETVAWDGVIHGCPKLYLSRLPSYSHHVLKQFPLLAPLLDSTPNPRHLPPRMHSSVWDFPPPMLCEITPPFPPEQVLQNKILFGSVILVSDEEKEGPVFLEARVGGYLSNL